MMEMEERIGRFDLAELDRRRTGVDSMERSDIIIADLSGVLFDWAFLYQKPIILAGADADLGGQEGEDLSGPIWDVETARAMAARCLSAQDIDRIPETVEQTVANRVREAGRIRQVRDREIYNFGKAGPAAAENIIRILGDMP